MAKVKAQADRPDLEITNQEPAPTEQQPKERPGIDEAIEDYLKSKYEFRFNAITVKPEFKPLGSGGDFIPMDKYTANSFKRELTKAFLKTSVQSIRELLASSFAPRIDPVKQYIKDLPQWDEVDYIAALADTVETTAPERWSLYLKKWLVGTVANVMIDIKCMNHVCLVLSGGQGAFKTSWLENLCPKKLQNYLLTTGNFDPENKDSLTAVAENFIINLDDILTKLNKNDENMLKNLITVNFIKYRRPYDEYTTAYPHIASFCASVNDEIFLTDVTGSRRFLPFRVVEKGININAAQAMDMDRVLSQAKALYLQGFEYWFTPQDVDELTRYNEAFRIVPIEEQLILSYYETPSEINDGKNVMFLSNADIKARLELLSRQNLQVKKIGEALKKLGYKKEQRRLKDGTAWGYVVIQKSDESIKLDREELAYAPIISNSALKNGHTHKQAELIPQPF